LERQAAKIILEGIEAAPPVAPRLAEIEDDIDQARAIGDDERAAQADAERDFLAYVPDPRAPDGWGLTSTGGDRDSTLLTASPSGRP
jgi:hypothetical protein